MDGMDLVEAFIHFRRALRTARAAVQANAEAYIEVVQVVESLGAYLVANCAGRTPSGLGKAAEVIRSVLFPDPRAWAGRPPPGHEPSVGTLYERLREVRNATVHEGASARIAGAHAIRLSLALEEALMTRLKDDPSVVPWMVPDPVVAQPWQTVSQVRTALLSGGYSALPLWWEGAWHFVRDVALVEYLRAGGALHLALSQAVTGPPALDLAPVLKAHNVTADTKVDALLKKGWPEGLPVLIVENGPQGPGSRLVGILTPHDLLV